jgi:MFS family permease
MKMNPAHVHLILNHIPLIGMGFTILLLIVALVRKSNELINVALIFTILVALWAIPVYLTGEPAEEVVEDLPGISEQMIEKHEERAEITFIFTEVTGVLALISLIVRRFSDNIGQKLTLLTLLVLLVSGGLMAWTANLGGKINHPEIRSDTGLSSSQINNEE